MSISSVLTTVSVRAKSLGTVHKNTMPFEIVTCKAWICQAPTIRCTFAEQCNNVGLIHLGPNNNSKVH